MNFGVLPMVSHETRLQRRFYGNAAEMSAVQTTIGHTLDADQALALGLVTAAPDDIDWADEIRIALEERASMSPDALTGMEASLRFAGAETMETRIFGRLTAWQNWIFIHSPIPGRRASSWTRRRIGSATDDQNRPGMPGRPPMPPITPDIFSLLVSRTLVAAALIAAVIRSSSMPTSFGSTTVLSILTRTTSN